MDATCSEPTPTPVAVPHGNLGASLGPADRAIFALGLDLQRRGYRFTTVSPASHRRVHGREHTGKRSVEDILGWNRAFAAAQVAQNDFARLADAGVLENVGALLRSTIRFSTLGQQLFVHSSFPTEQSDAVFFGPDTYRFARFMDSSSGFANPSVA
jgi:hypothetical protein